LDRLCRHLAARRTSLLVRRSLPLIALANGALIVYALANFVGLKAAWEDLRFTRTSAAAITPFNPFVAPEAD
jgi:hypothetical protein